jgi:isoleucyl-tRNA synthetase
LRRLTVSGAPLAQRHADEIGEELRVKEVVFSDGGSAVSIKPNLPVLGPRLGARLRDVQRALQAGEFEELPDGRYIAAGEELGADEVLRSGGGVSVVFDSDLDDELLLEGRVLDLIHHVNTLRKQEGLELTDRIVLTLPQAQADVLEHEEWIKRETLAVRVETDSVEAPQIAKA